jgi:drug/metabolite transporter (DMT)-like permease
MMPLIKVSRHPSLPSVSLTVLISLTIYFSQNNVGIISAFSPSTLKYNRHVAQTSNNALVYARKAKQTSTYHQKLDDSIRRQRVFLKMATTTQEDERTSVATTTSTMDIDSQPMTSTTELVNAGMPELSIRETANDEEYRRGLFTIGFITLLFSSNSPALHAAFSNPSFAAPPVLLLNAAVSAVALVGLLFGGSLLESTTPLPSSFVQNQQEGQKQDNSMLKLQAGLELGLWKFLGTTANLYGLSYTTADHGAFLIQLTTLIVPVVQGIMGVPIPRRIQFSVCLALAGVFMFTQDPTMCAETQSATGEAASTVALGDALCVVAAGFYATYDLRLFSWGKLVKPKDLITNKIATQAVFSLLLLFALGWTESVDFVSSVITESSSSSILEATGFLIPVILWSGVAVNAIAPFLQVGGQQAVGPTRAQTLYASQPLWASIISYVCLGETVGTQGLIGGVAFLTALGLAATAEAPDPDCGQKPCEV